jgi:hypothetical protein
VRFCQNFYLTGFCLVLLIVIGRIYKLLKQVNNPNPNPTPTPTPTPTLTPTPNQVWAADELLGGLT